jgi:hypothetical protein
MPPITSVAARRRHASVTFTKRSINERMRNIRKQSQTIEAERLILKSTTVHAWIEAAAPSPLVDVDGAAGASRDRADMDIAVIDVPAVRALGIAAAGKGGHKP